MESYSYRWTVVFFILTAAADVTSGSRRTCATNLSIFQMNGVDVPCQFRVHDNSKACKADANSLHEFRIRPPLILPKNYIRLKWKSVLDDLGLRLNLTWIQRTPVGVYLKGYILRLHFGFHQWNQSCHYIEFQSSVLLANDENLFSVGCLPVKTVASHVSVFPVINSYHVRTGRFLLQATTVHSKVNNNVVPDAKNVSIHIAYNKDREVLQIKLDKQNFITNDNKFNGFLAVLCKKNCTVNGHPIPQPNYTDPNVKCQTLGCGYNWLGGPLPQAINPDQEDILVEYKLDKKLEILTYYIQLCPVYNFQMESRLNSQNSPEFDFLRNDVIESNSCIKTLDSKLLKLQLDTIPDKENKKITVKVTLPPQNDCQITIKDYFIQLLRLKMGPCDINNQNKIRIANQTITKVQTSTNGLLIAEFNDLPPGNYCVWVFPRSYACQGVANKCPGKSKSCKLKAVETPDTSELYYFVVGGIVAVLLLLIGLFFTKKCYDDKLGVTSLHCQPTLSIINHTLTNIQEEPFIATPENVYTNVRSKNKKEVLLLWYMLEPQSIKIVESSILVMDKILYVNLNDIERRSEADDFILINGPAAWVKHSMDDDNVDHIFFVAPDSNIEELLNSEDYVTKSEAENIYIHALRYASNNMKVAAKCLMLRFDGLNQFKVLETTIGNKKWTIPKDFTSLFYAIHGEEFDYVAFLKYWKNDVDLIKFTKLLHNSEAKVTVTSE